MDALNTLTLSVMNAGNTHHSGISQVNMYHLIITEMKEFTNFYPIMLSILLNRKDIFNHFYYVADDEVIYFACCLVGEIHPAIKEPDLTWSHQFKPADYQMLVDYTADAMEDLLTECDGYVHIETLHHWITQRVKVIVE
jgi:hypothetical protein